ncbi:MAG TPA: hypothetical protein VFF75_01945 [Methylophilaceae bacterium]|nr:hypothetical protein [Methylophilaceae bacterium]
MTAQNQNLLYCNQPGGRQKGVVLFLALMALVLMSIAAVALIRTVDTSTLIAGNLAFTQSATTSADSGMESAIAWLGANAETLDADNKGAGYYSYVDDNPASGTYLDLMSEDTWKTGASAVATGADMTDGLDTSGNTIRYVIQRMCSVTGPPAAATCLFGPPADDDGCKRTPDPMCATGSTSTTVMYRVTAKVTGPRNTVSYIQAFVY